jgi:predicted HicB family RNase H-like nuclease
MNTMLYKGYHARIEFDEQDRIFVGHLAGIRDIVGFHGSSVDELEVAFHEAVDDYLAHCTKLGLPANKPFSGRMLLRVPPEVHAQASIAAKVAGLSLNQWAAQALANQAGTSSHA